MKDPSSGASHNSIDSASNQFGAFDVSGKQSVIAISLDVVSISVGSKLISPPARIESFRGSSIIKSI